jgi:tetratricopeptide (TPR) repeat protein
VRQVAVILSVTLAATVAFAQHGPTAQQRKAAKAHFEQGRAFYESGAWTDAVREYEQAFALVPLPELLFNIGQAWRMQGDKAKAIDAYRRYLDRLPDGPLAEEARNHVTALTLKIRIEEAEAARQRALAGEAAARKQAAEAEAARRRAEAETATRLKAQQEDEALLRRVAAEEAERLRRAKEEAAAARAEAQRAGRGLRIGGWTLTVAGALCVGGAIFVGRDVVSKRKEVDEFNNDPTATWDEGIDGRISPGPLMQKLVLGLSIAGGVAIAGGVTMLILAVRQRAHASERLRSRLALVPALGPGAGALVLTGGF